LLYPINWNTSNTSLGPSLGYKFTFDGFIQLCLARAGKHESEYLQKKYKEIQFSVFKEFLITKKGIMKTLKMHLSPNALKSKDLFSCHSKKIA
jgi:hypothetical protein